MFSLPDSIRALVTVHMAAEGVDYTDPRAMYGECETQSYRLVRALRTAGIEAAPAQIDVPSADEMAAGHFVVRARVPVLDEDGDVVGYERWVIDLTAAQFEIYSGPRAWEE